MRPESANATLSARSALRFGLFGPIRRNAETILKLIDLVVSRYRGRFELPLLRLHPSLLSGAALGPKPQDTSPSRWLFLGQNPVNHP